MTTTDSHRRPNKPWRDVSDVTQILTDLINDLRSLQRYHFVDSHLLDAPLNRAVFRFEQLDAPQPSVSMVSVGAGELDHIEVDDAEFEQWKADHNCRGSDKGLRLVYKLQKRAGRV